jgi:hypothetical protein
MCMQILSHPRRCRCSLHMTTLSGIYHIFGTVSRTFAHIRTLFAHYSQTCRSVFSAIRTLFAQPSQRIPRDSHAIRTSSPHFPSYSHVFTLSKLFTVYAHGSHTIHSIRRAFTAIRTLFAHYSHTVRTLFAHYSHPFAPVRASGANLFAHIRILFAPVRTPFAHVNMCLYPPLSVVLG